ncbi:hypothetical protein NXY11_02260 [Parabacteroides faecis]|nr:hypothetical protein [Parabacteroides faecis]MCS2894323.1 hypothetical protein [Parabacteroides faecis]UVQ47095.1 hypothetical protein NXY11_02260 [Parabacteroides faecis]
MADRVRHDRMVTFGRSSSHVSIPVYIRLRAKHTGSNAGMLSAIK